jgi:hypothetical protein
LINFLQLLATLSFGFNAAQNQSNQSISQLALTVTMSESRQPLVKGGHIHNKMWTPSTFNSITPPVVHSNTIIIAATHPTLSTGNPHKDGWFLSDFYAFNCDRPRALL